MTTLWSAPRRASRRVADKAALDLSGLETVDTPRSRADPVTTGLASFSQPPVGCPRRVPRPRRKKAA